MKKNCDIAAVHRRFRAVGAALMRVNFNNTHSGNMSCRDVADPDRFWITASGSQCGDLSPADLVSVRFDDLTHEGAARPSSETHTHRRVLELPEVRACVHCHTIASTLIGFETPQKPIFLFRSDFGRPKQTEFLFQPVDVWGADLIGAVNVGIYRNTVGSPEMERRIPAYLKRMPITVVKGHGPFACGKNLLECLHFLNVFENSAATALALRRRGIDPLAFQQAIFDQGVQAIFPWHPRRLDCMEGALPEANPAIRSEFAKWLGYNFDLGLGAFGTGSMSCRISDDEMIFCPMSAAPAGIEAPLYRMRLQPDRDDATDVFLHHRIYAETHYRTCMLTASPLATAEAMAAMAEVHGVKVLTGQPEASGHPLYEYPLVTPIDAEAAYHNVRLPVTGMPALAPPTGEDILPILLRAGNGCCLIAGGGVIAAGEDNLAQAAYRVSLAERIARFRLEADLNHRLLDSPALSALE